MLVKKIKMLMFQTFGIRFLYCSNLNVLMVRKLIKTWKINRIMYRNVSFLEYTVIIFLCIPMPIHVEKIDKNEPYNMFVSVAISSICVDHRWTALHKASRDGHRDVVETLLQAGADHSLVDTLGWVKSYNFDCRLY